MSSIHDLQKERARSQLLLGERQRRTVADLVRHLICVPAGLDMGDRDSIPDGTYSDPSMTLRARNWDMPRNALRAARNDDRSVVQSWTLRGAPFLVAAEDFGWLGTLREASSPVYVSDNRVGEAVLAALASKGPMTREELEEELLHRRGLPPRPDQRVPFWLLASLGQHICLGPSSQTRPLTLVLAADWIRERAYVPRDPWSELARRYIDAYGPVSPEDFAGWAACSLSRARSSFRGVAALYREVPVGRIRWGLVKPRSADEDEADRQPVRLVNARDPIMRGYGETKTPFAHWKQRRMRQFGYRAVLFKGRGVGLWWFEGDRRNVTLHVLPLEELTGKTIGGISFEAQDLARWLRRPTGFTFDSWEYCRQLGLRAHSSFPVLDPNYVAERSLPAREARLYRYRHSSPW